MGPAGGVYNCFFQLPHAYHHLGCGCDHLRFDRHEAIASATATHLKPEGPYRCDLRKNLNSSTVYGTKVDLKLTCYSAAQVVTSIDVTVSCPLTLTYHRTAATSADAIFNERDAEKRAKHLAGSASADIAYYTAALTTLGGVGPRSFLDFLAAVFRRAAQRSRSPPPAAGARPSPAATISTPPCRPPSSAPPPSCSATTSAPPP